MFTPDEPDDTSATSTGTLRLNSVEHRCVRLRASGLAHSYSLWSYEIDFDSDDYTPYEVSESDKVRFLAVHGAFKDVIEKHGPEIFLVHPSDQAVYVEEIQAKSMYDFMNEIAWDSPQEVNTAIQVVHNALDLMSSIERDGFCAPTGVKGYVVTPGLTVRQVDFEEIVQIMNSAPCEQKMQLEESVHAVLREELTELYGYDDGYDKADNILTDMFHAHVSYE